MSPTTVWVVVQKDRAGQPRGFEKVLNERYHLIEDEANAELKKLSDELSVGTAGYVVAECVIMRTTEYYGLVSYRDALAWQLYCAETAGDMDVRDHWSQLSQKVQHVYLEKADKAVESFRS